MIGVELRKQLPRARTWVALAVMAAVPVIMTIGFAVGGTPHGDRGDGGPGFFEAATNSGVNLPVTALFVMQRFLLVVVVCLFAGETVSGEAAWGSLRYLLVRPVSRPRLLTAKLLVASLLCVVATVVVGVVGLGVGTAAFGWHDVALPFVAPIPAGQAVLKLAEATGYVAWGMAGTVAFAFLLSTMTDAPFGPVFGGLAFAMVSQIIDAISAFGSIRNGLPTHYWQAWVQLFSPLGDKTSMVTGALVQLPYVAVFVAAAYYWFRRKDVLS